MRKSNRTEKKWFNISDVRFPTPNNYQQSNIFSLPNFRENNQQWFNIHFQAFLTTSNKNSLSTIFSYQNLSENQKKWFKILVPPSVAAFSVMPISYPLLKLLSMKQQNNNPSLSDLRKIAKADYNNNRFPFSRQLMLGFAPSLVTSIPNKLAFLTPVNFFKDKYQGASPEVQQRALCAGILMSSILQGIINYSPRMVQLNGGSALQYCHWNTIKTKLPPYLFFMGIANASTLGGYELTKKKLSEHYPDFYENNQAKGNVIASFIALPLAQLFIIGPDIWTIEKMSNLPVKSLDRKARIALLGWRIFAKTIENGLLLVTADYLRKKISAVENQTENNTPSAPTNSP